MGINTSRERKNANAVLWDEPDLGLSDSYAMGVALAISEFVQEPPEKLFFAAVVSHRRCMMAELAKGKPHHIHLAKSGGRPLSIQEWLERPIETRTLKTLAEENIALFRRIHKEFGL